MKQTVAQKPARSGAQTEAPMVGRRERAKLEKRSKIVESARSLFRSKGFDATTTLEIAERADIGSGTLFLYARTKDDLLMMVFHDEIMEITRDALEDVPARMSLVGQLMHVFKQMVVYHEQDIDLSKTLLKLLMVPPNSDRFTDVQEMLALVHGSLATLVDAKKESGDIRTGVDSPLAANLFFSIYYVGLIYWLAGHVGQDQFVADLERKLGLAIEGMSI